MVTTVDQLQQWMDVPEEGGHIEFKQAKKKYDFDKLVEYCAALANEGGGRMILGVTNNRPREVVDSRAFPGLQSTVADVSHIQPDEPLAALIRQAYVELSAHRL